MDTMNCPHCLGIPQAALCPVCGGEGWVIEVWGDLWIAQRAQEPLAYVMDYCDECDAIRPVVRIHRRWLCPDCAAATLNEERRRTSFAEILEQIFFGVTA